KERVIRRRVQAPITEKPAWLEDGEPRAGVRGPASIRLGSCSVRRSPSGIVGVREGRWAPRKCSTDNRRRSLRSVVAVPPRPQPSVPAEEFPLGHIAAGPSSGGVPQKEFLLFCWFALDRRPPFVSPSQVLGDTKGG